jgi:predicted permease
MLERWRVRARALFRGRTVHEELDEELRYHLDAETARNVALGMDPASAALAARRAFGNPTQLREEMRDAVAHRWLERIGQDTRYALRVFRRAPGFSLTVVATIALALGLNTTAFTIFDAYVLRPAAVRDPSSLYQLGWSDRSGTGHGFTWQDAQSLRDDHDALAESFAFRFLMARIDSTPAYGQLVSGNYFSMLGIGATLGRTLVASDAATRDGAPVVVLSHTAWRSRFGSDSSIVGKTIRVRGHALQVIGVAAPGFGGLGDIPIDFWAPITMNDVLIAGDSLFSPRAPATLSVVGRLQPGVGDHQAEAWLVGFMRSRRSDARERDVPTAAQIVSQATGIELSPEFVLFFTPIATAFVLVLLIACANVANMMLARGLARQRELGIRLSLGAARGRLIGQLLTEAVLLASLAAVAGFALSRFTLGAGVRLMFATMPVELAPYMRMVPLAPDGRVFVFMLVAATASAVLFGLAPALQATRPNIVQATRGDFDTEYRPSRLRNGLVIGQVTVCVLLLACAGILLRSVGRMQQVDLGLRTHRIVRLGVSNAPGARDRVLSQLRREPVVRQLGAASSTLFAGRFPSIAAGGVDAHVTSMFYDFVSASYFDLLGVPITRGRGFTIDEERAAAPVVVISEATARVFWPSHDAIGETLRLTGETTDARFAARREARVIGIVPDVALGTVIDPFDSPVAYYPMAAEAPGMALLAHVDGNEEVTMRQLDATLARAVPAAIDEIHALDTYVIGSVYPFRAAYWVAAALGAIALLLTLTGVYGVLSYVVAQRRKELGIRVALGAGVSTVVGLVLGQSLRLCVIGLGAGLVLAVGVARLFAANVVRLNTFEPIAFGGAAMLVLAACLVAAYVPSRRAGRVDPLEALRGE